MMRWPQLAAAVDDFAAPKVLAGFQLTAPASGLTPAITTGILYAQGIKYAPSAAPALPAVSSTAGTYYLWYNSASGFYWNSSGTTPTTAGDCQVGNATVASGVISSCTDWQTVNDPKYGAIGGLIEFQRQITASGAITITTQPGAYYRL